MVMVVVVMVMVRLVKYVALSGCYLTPRPLCMRLPGCIVLAHTHSPNFTLVYEQKPTILVSAGNDSWLYISQQNYTLYWWWFWNCVATLGCESTVMYMFVKRMCVLEKKKKRKTKSHVSGIIKSVHCGKMWIGLMQVWGQRSTFSSFSIIASGNCDENPDISLPSGKML